jgi:extracellular elastinolytic metalloproteinase
MSTTPIRGAWRAIVLALMGALALTLPATAFGAAKIEGIHTEPLGDLDLRAGTVAPSAQQLRLVSDMGSGVSVSWNEFGTPRSLSKPTVKNGTLGTASGETAAAAAKNWLAANKALFRLDSVSNLNVLADTPMEGSDGWIVTFRQEFGGLAAAVDGLATVGLKGSSGSGWDIVYVSSSIIGADALAARPAISPAVAWVTAAANVGLAYSVLDVRGAKQDREWKVFSVKGLNQVQRTRLVALPTPLNGVRPAFETIVLASPGGMTMGYRTFVDAVSGNVLLRINIVEHSHPKLTVFQGSMPAGDGACHADFAAGTVTPAEAGQDKSIVASVEAALTTNDSVIHIVKDGVIVASQDTLFSPEVVVYEPPGGVPAGTYHVRVCDFVDGVGWTAPTTFAGHVQFNPVSGNVPYPPKWKVFPAFPLLYSTVGHPWNIPSTDIREVWCWDAVIAGNPPSTVPGCDRELDNLAARVPWDHNPKTGAPTFTTFGNTANTGESWTAPLTPGAFGHHPVSATREYVYPWENEWYERNCDPAAIAPPQTPVPSTVSNDISPAVVNLFAMHNRMHDWSYFLGFREETWNAQLDNFGVNTVGERDPLEGDAQAGATDGAYPSYTGRDNANMITLPDGTASITNMYLWQPIASSFYAPCVDGDYDMAVIGHEFTHMIENRMIGKGGGRTGAHAGAMGESVADFTAMEYLNEYSFVPVSGENPYSVGAYAAGNPQLGIRNYGMNMSPLNFSNMGYDVFGPEPMVHANGEIWSATQFDIRTNMNAFVDATTPWQSSDQTLQEHCADGKDTADHCPGNRRWIQNYFDAMLLMPVGPTMLEARNAQIAADTLRFGGVHHNVLWGSFAGRGFGQFATTGNTSSTGPTETDPKPDFIQPGPPNAIVTFEARNADTNALIDGVRVYAGHYEARTSPIAVTDTDATPDATGEAGAGASNLDDTAGFVSKGYDFVAKAPGYGHLRFHSVFAWGVTGTVTIYMPPNLASSTNGATAGPGTGSDGTSHGNLIDDTESTQWASLLLAPVAGKQVTVDLAGGTQTVDRVQVSAYLNANNRFSTLRKFEILTCTTGAAVGNPNCLGSLYPSGFTSIFVSADDAFPGDVPRPVLPQMLLRSFDVPNTSATHVMIRVLTNQCTGQPKFQGIQDSDLTNPTDCTSAEPRLPLAPAVQDNNVRIAELEVFSSEGAAVNAADPAVALTKTGPVTAAPGSEITYTIKYANIGPADAEEAKIIDALPGQLVFVSASDGGSYDASQNAVKWNLGSVASGLKGQVTVTARLRDGLKIGTVLTNTATFTGTLVTSPPTAVATTMVVP